jgi:formylmethanofuran dehydrogenase subunit E
MINKRTFNTSLLLFDFGVKTEDELYNLLIKESETIPCQRCGQEFSIDKICFIDGDPFCLSCVE